MSTMAPSTFSFHDMKFCDVTTRYGHGFPVSVSVLKLVLPHPTILPRPANSTRISLDPIDKVSYYTSAFRWVFRIYLV